MSVSPYRPVARSTGASSISVNLPEAEQIERVVNRLIQMGADPAQIGVVKAPLRICPLGAHIDHQLGIVTGMTIDQSVILAFAPLEEGTVRVESLNFPGEATFGLEDVPKAARGDWANYIRGAVSSLRQQHHITQGLLGVVGGVMPIGGLSSSAAVTTAYLIALESLNSLALTESENVELCRLTENAYIGLNNGILDQSVILFGRKGHLTRIDCQSVEIDRLPAPVRHDEAFAILVVYSGVTHALTGTDYNSRVAECQEAARLMLKADGQTPPEDVRLRHVQPELFEDYGSTLPAPIYRRARHYFGEMARVLAGQDAWMRGDLTAFGRLVNESGESSVKWYECGSPQLITLYETLRDAAGVYGARFSGAGFRGSCIALVKPEAVEDIAAAVHEIYPARHPEEAERYSIHICAQDGHARLLDRTELEGYL